MIDQKAQTISLKDQIGYIFEEARMVLPGIQALFGFQMIAVFNERFAELPMYAQNCHVVALALVVMAIALVMLPAAYNRLVQPDIITLHTVKLCSRAICYALVPLAGGIALDLFVVLHAVASRPAVIGAMAFASFTLLIGSWFGYPLWSRHRQERRNATTAD